MEGFISLDEIVKDITKLYQNSTDEEFKHCILSIKNKGCNKCSFVSTCAIKGFPWVLEKYKVSKDPEGIIIKI